MNAIHVTLRIVNVLKVVHGVYNFPCSAGFRTYEALCYLSYEASYLGPERGQLGRPTHAVRLTSSGKLGIVKINILAIPNFPEVRHVHCVFNKLEDIIYYPKPQLSQHCLTQVT